MKFNFDLEKFSNARTSIMGCAMLLVVVFHSSIDVSIVSILNFIKSIGDIGVDIFLFVSGIGICHALQKYPNFKQYWHRRLLRIIPPFFLINTLWFIAYDLVLYHTDVVTFFKDITSLSFWLNGNLTTWYLSSLLVLQLISPVIVKVINKSYITFVAVICSIFLVSLVVRFTPLNNTLGHLLIWWCRIPSYLCGLYIGKLIQDKRKVNVSIFSVVIILLLSMTIVAVSVGYTAFYIPYMFKYLAYCPIAIILSALVTYIPVNKFFLFLGKHSLEIYLLHEKILWVSENFIRVAFPVTYNVMGRKMIFNILIFGITCVGSVILKWIYKIIYRRKDF